MRWLIRRIYGLPAAVYAVVAAMLAAFLTIPGLPPQAWGAIVAFVVMLTAATILVAVHRDDEENARFGVLERRTALVHVLSDNSKTRLISELWSMQAEIQRLTSDYRLTRLLNEKYGQPAVVERNGQQYTPEMLETEAAYRFADQYATRLLFLLVELQRHGVAVEDRLHDLISTVSNADGVDNVAEELRLMMNQQATAAT